MVNNYGSPSLDGDHRVHTNTCGPRIVGVGLEGTTFYDPKTSTERHGPRLCWDKLDPVVISHGGKVYALSRSPAVVLGLDFEPWFLVFHSVDHNNWDFLPPPPVFPCPLNPLEYRDPPKVRVAAYAIVDSHILLSVQQDKGNCACRYVGTCAFDLHANQWEMVHDENLPFTGQAVPFGDHRFVACSKENGGDAAAVYHVEVRISVAGKKELSILELHGAYKRGVIPGHLLCAMGKGSFSSVAVRSIASPAKKDRARIVHRTYSLVEGDEDDAQAGSGSGIVLKQDRQIYKL